MCLRRRWGVQQPHLPARAPGWVVGGLHIPREEELGNTRRERGWRGGGAPPLLPSLREVKERGVMREVDSRCGDGGTPPPPPP